MSSNIKIQRVCKHCGDEFTARTTVTKFCSHQCSKRNWKKRNREKKIENSEQETIQTLSLPIEKIKANDFYTLAEVAKLIRICRTTLFKIIKSGDLKTIKIISKTIIAKKDLEDFLQRSTQHTNLINVESTSNEETELISFPEIIHLYHISDATLYTMAKRKQITKKKIMGTNFVPKHQIIKVLGNPKDIKHE